MKFTLEIDCGNAAFGESEEWRGEEVSRILEKVAHQAACGYTKGQMYDINGNPVGVFKFYEEETA